MRSFSLLQDAIVPYIPTLIGQLTHKLLLVSKVSQSINLLSTKGGFNSGLCLVNVVLVSIHGIGFTGRTHRNIRPLKGTFPKPDLILKAGRNTSMQMFHTQGVFSMAHYHTFQHTILLVVFLKHVNYQRIATH